ncbi:MAG TPA: MXAN_5187 C-terminal domain-containing protein [Polyangiaceae bacterium]
MDQAELERLVGELELAVDRTRSLYEQYFMGIERIEPTVPRKDVDRRIHVLRKEQIRNTGLRFRFLMLVQRYNTYQTHWQRICREIENGTYKRHVIRAQQRFGVDRGRASVPPPSVASSLSQAVAAAPSMPIPKDLAAELAELDREFAPAEELDDLDVELDEEPTPIAPPTRPAAHAPATRHAPTWRKAAPAAPRKTVHPAPAAPPAPPRPATPVPRPPPVAPRPAPVAVAAVGPPAPARRPDDLPDERVRQLYAQYVEAKRRHNESTAAITYDAVAKSLRESSEKLRQKHGKAVDFEVSVKDGKTVLKPVLK